MKRFFPLLFLLTCGRLPPSIGLTSEIAIVTDSDRVFDTLSQAIQITYRTPRREEKYRFLRVELAKLTQILRFHLIILADPIQRSEVGTFIQELLAPDAEAKVTKEGFGIFRIKDQWAEGQEILIITGSNDSALLSGINLAEQRIRSIINEHYFNRISNETFSIGEDEKLAQYLEQNYAVHLRIPEGYRLEERYREDGFIYLHRHDPDRVIFITKVRREDSITIDWLLDERDILTLLYYEGDYAYRDLCFGGWSERSGRRFFKIYGVWQNDSLGVGGPFVLYCFPYSGVCYLIDGMIYAPGERKLSYLTSLEAIITTFQPLDTLSSTTKIYQLREVYRG
ncbi:hypothetical protein DRP53_02355 [candidate division WOR-3 bacterium]|uniref:DUF4837 family protein n=1 Tax=candidate division WOR-3 bacterium TaxID=2052148 RepID=A0A660SK83_UNCW3|nr:MAG: hypothetical protein DRP53_02355 [candidate division WOR-3 bacterium]